MTDERRALATAATVRAAQLRASQDVGLADAACPFDIASKAGIELRFADIPSMEGVYKAGPHPIIVLSSLRPSGRQAFTCAHEIGHDAFGHGDQYDELVESRSRDRRFDPAEYQADCFAGALLMPKSAVGYGFATRGWDAATSTPAQVYTISSWLGVGYTTLSRHLALLNMISRHHAASLRRHQPKDIRKELVAQDCVGLTVADSHWTGRPADVRVGELLLCPAKSIPAGEVLDVVDRSPAHVVFRAITSGEGRVHHSQFSVSVRVARNEYVGRGIYRFLPEEE